MKHGKNPYVCFKIEEGASRAAEARVLDQLAQHLRTRLGGFRFIAKRKWFYPAWVCEVKVGQNLASLGLFKSRFADDEVILRVGPLTPSDAPVLLPRLRWRTPKPFVSNEELKSVCREIQLFLTNEARISRVRWYFETRAGVTSGFATPDELQW
jgi:hypothetical protein